MKYFNKLLLVLLCSWGIALHIQAQDIHFTMYDMSPLTLNPANTGAFLGTARLSGIVRSQWGRTYDTPSFSVDGPVVAVGKKKRDWLGVGLTFVNDVAGELRLTTNYTMLSGAFHKVLDKKNKNVLTIGVQGGAVQRSVTASQDAEWRTPGMLQAQFNPATSGLTPQELLTDFQGQLGMLDSEPGKERYNSTPSAEYNIGFRLSSQMNDDAKLVLGVAFDNPFRINLSLDSTSRAPSQGIGTITTGEFDMDRDRVKPYKRPGLTTIHATLDYNLTEKILIRPTALYQSVPGYRNIILQTHLGYYVTDNKDTMVRGGLGYRFGNALQLIAGLEYKDWVIGASYDYNTQLYGGDGRYRNGFEIGLTYILKIFKEPEVNPAILCPKL